jgi:hypothetical protein
MKEWLTKFASTRWKGKGELWLDPEGNSATDYECHLNFLDDGIRYTWMYENEEKTGNFRFNDAGAVWKDSWHQPSPVQCTSDSEAWGLFTVSYEYEVPENPNWGWRSKLSQRPDGTLVLQMTNIAPWGEEGRAVRMVFQRD